MSSSAEVKETYDKAALNYSGFAGLPMGLIESELIRNALGDCTGLAILDLGGGIGVHARQAVSLGAAAVDVVDLSSESIQIGEHIEKSAPRVGSVVRFFEGNVSEPLDSFPLRHHGYDVVMAYGIFHHASSREVLEGMFRNVVTYLKPHGRFIYLRDEGEEGNGREKKYERYGLSYPWLEDIPGGKKGGLIVHSDPPFELTLYTLDILHSDSTELHEQFGLTDVKTVPWKDVEIVKKDPDFWKPFVDDPSFVIVTAVKKSD